MIRAVLVDVDDTLVRTEAASFELEDRVVRRLGQPPIDRDVHLATWGMPLAEAIGIRSPGVDPVAFATAFTIEFQRYVRERRIDVVPPGNVAALDELRSAGRSVFLLTSRTGDEVAHLVAALGSRLSGAFHLDNTRYAKPDPRVFDEFLASSGLHPPQCAYVGDSPTDARAAIGAGLRFVACLEAGIRRRADFDGQPVDAFIDRFTDIVAAVTALDARRRPSETTGTRGRS